MNIVWNILCTNHHNIVAVLSLQREHLARRHFEISGADPGGEGAPPKIGKNMIFFWCQIYISHEIPQQKLCLPLLGAIFLSLLPLT